MPTVADTEQCSANQQYNVCFCRMYRFSKDGVGPAPGSQNVEHPMDYCDKIIGWKPAEYKKVATYWEQFRIWLLAQQQPSTK